MTAITTMWTESLWAFPESYTADESWIVRSSDSGQRGNKRAHNSTIKLTGVLFTIPAFILIWFAGASRLPTHPHAILGVILMAITLVQPFIGIFRPHIKKDGTKSVYRIIWEWIHRIWGLSIILIGFAQVTLGVFLISPPRGVWIAWLSLLGSWVIHFIVAEIIRCACMCYWRGRNKCEDGKDEEVEMKNKHP